MTPTDMRAWTLSRQAPVDDNPLVCTSLPVPTPGEGEVLVKVRACGICRTDLHVVEGDLAMRRAQIVPGHQVVGDVVALGPNVTERAVGERVGIAWLHRTCGGCRFCETQRENLCESPDFTGWTVDGGFAEYAVAPAAFCYGLPSGLSHLLAAPLLCAGIIGFRSLELAELRRGEKLGIYGFGAAGHVVIQLARARGLEVFVATRDRARHQALAHELGAAWVGDAQDRPPAALDASLVFAPAGELVPGALRALDKGGRLVLGGIHMSDIPSFPYEILYGERLVRSVTNNTREDGRRFLEEAARIPVRAHVETFSFERANEALQALKNDAVRGAAVLTMD